MELGFSMTVGEIQRKYEKLRKWLDRSIDELAVWWHQLDQCTKSIGDLEHELERERYQLYLEMLANQARKISIIAERRLLVDDQLRSRRNEHTFTEHNSVAGKGQDNLSFENCGNQDAKDGKDVEALDIVDYETEVSNNEEESEEKISNETRSGEIIDFDNVVKKSNREMTNYGQGGDKLLYDHQVNETVETDCASENAIGHKCGFSEQTMIGPNQCSLILSTRGSLLRHQRTVHGLGVKPHQCSHCDKRFHCNYLLINHLRTHTNERPYRCDQCDKQFKQKCALNRHRLIHTGVRSHKCLQCGKLFKQHGHLKTHQIIHTGLKPHQCSYCNKNFARKDYLLKHMPTHMKQ